MVGKSTRKHEQGAHVREPFRSHRVDHRCDQEFETRRGLKREQFLNQLVRV